MKKSTLTTAAAAAFAALSIGVAASANAAPSGPSIPQPPGHETGGDAHTWFTKPGQNAFGWYQNDVKRQSPSRR